MTVSFQAVGRPPSSKLEDKGDRTVCVCVMDKKHWLRGEVRSEKVPDTVCRGTKTGRSGG